MDDILSIIKAHGGELVRSHRHCMYRFPDGRTFVMSATPNDWRVAQQQMTTLRRFLGIARESHKNPHLAVTARKRE